MRLQALFGVIPNLKSKGPSARAVLDMMLRMRREEGDASLAAPEIDTLIILDREVDLATPMVTPLTFEALIDEIIGIDRTLITVDSEILGADKDAKEGGKGCGTPARAAAAVRVW